jgi:lipoprotein NlpD
LAWAAASRRLSFSIVAIVLTAGCHPSRPEPMHAERPAGRWHVVAAGETLETIAKSADVPMADLMEINGLSDPSVVRPGRVIFVLASPGQAPSAPAHDDGASLPSLAIGAGQTPLRWPLAPGRIVVGSPFGTREGRPHEGIDLPAPVGTPVFAAADGRVAYAGNGIRGYGNMVVVRHGGDLLTVYAHNSVLLVAPGQPVRSGDRIALVGQSGHATGPHLHFEERAGQIPRNPMSFLPRLGKGPSS